MRKPARRSKEQEALSWRGHWMVPVEVRIRPKSDKFPKKDKSRKTNKRKLRQRKPRVPNKFGRIHAEKMRIELDRCR